MTPAGLSDARTKCDTIFPQSAYRRDHGLMSCSIARFPILCATAAAGHDFFFILLLLPDRGT